jgi:hypothetical protein
MLLSWYPMDIAVLALLLGITTVLCSLQSVNASVPTGVLELDSAVVARDLKLDVPNLTVSYSVIGDVRAALGNFSSHSISVVNRKYNRLAHELATIARSQGDQHLIADLPSSLHPLMISECNQQTQGKI